MSVRPLVPLANGDELLDVADLAQETGLPASSLYRAIDEERLPAVRLGVRRVKVRRSEALRFLGQVPAAADHWQRLEQYSTRVGDQLVRITVDVAPAL